MFHHKNASKSRWSPDAKNGDVLRWEHIGFLGFLDARLSSATFFSTEGSCWRSFFCSFYSDKWLKCQDRKNPERFMLIGFARFIGMVLRKICSCFHGFSPRLWEFPDNINGGFHQWAIPRLAGWFISMGKSHRSKWMMTGGSSTRWCPILKQVSL